MSAKKAAAKKMAKKVPARKVPARKAAKTAKKAPTKRPKPAKKAHRGRPSSYRPEFAAQAGKLCRLGATDADIAAFFEVTEVTINAWKLKHADFLESLKEGKVSADTLVEKSLFKRAIGYRQPAIKIMQHKGVPVIQPYEQVHAPDVGACIFWLKNRRPDLWRDKVEVKAEHSGEIGSGSGFTPEEDAAISEFVGNIRGSLKAPGT